MSDIGTIVDVAPPELVGLTWRDVWFALYHPTLPCPASLRLQVAGADRSGFLVFSTEDKAREGRKQWYPGGRIGTVAALAFDAWARSVGYWVLVDAEQRDDGLFFFRFDEAATAPGGSA